MTDNTTFAKNIAHQAILRGSTARFTTASNDDDGVAIVLEALIEAVTRNDA